MARRPISRTACRTTLCRSSTAPRSAHGSWRDACRPRTPSRSCVTSRARSRTPTSTVSCIATSSRRTCCCRETAVVADFGIAKAISAARGSAGRPGAPPGSKDFPGGGTLTERGTSLGTPAYMAPEQVAGEETMDHRVDIYAWGMLAHELLAGRHPFAGKSASQLLAAQIAEVPPPLGPDDAPPAVADVVRRCLAKSPDDRPHKATDVLRALDAAVPRRPRLGGCGTGSSPGSRSPSLPASPQSCCGRRPTRPAAPSRSRRRRIWRSMRRSRRMGGSSPTPEVRRRDSGSTSGRSPTDDP